MGIFFRSATCHLSVRYSYVISSLVNLPSAAIVNDKLATMRDKIQKKVIRILNLKCIF